MSTNYDVRPAPPKPDLSKYPQIPKGACLNWNKTTRTFQVYGAFKDLKLPSSKCLLSLTQ